MAEKSKPGKEKGGSAAFKQGEEKVLIIPLRHESRKSAKNKRMNRSVREIKAFLARHMHTELSSIQISQQLNEFLWKGGLHNPPSRIKIKVSTDKEGKVLASLMEEKEKARKESKRRLGLRQRLARRREAAKEEKPEIKEKPAAEKKPEPPKEKPKKQPAEAPEEIDQELMLQE
jgi:large subunit ribosomal protein L31e